MKTSDQVRRVLLLIPYLRSHPGASIADLAQLVGASPAVIRADLEMIPLCGLPGGLPDDLIDIDYDAFEDGIVFLSNVDYLSRPLRLTPDEALSLVLALRVVEEVASEETVAALRTARTKLEAITGTIPDGVAGITVAGGETSVREKVAAAVERGERLRLTYDGLVRGATTDPLVDPLRIFVLDGLTYVDAWNLDSDGWRVYRLDRIVAAAPTGEAAVAHPDPPPARAGWLDRLNAAAEVVLELDAETTWITEYYPIVSVEPAGAGLRVRVRVADPVWLRGLLLRLGGGARVVEPAEAGSSAATLAREALAAYQAAGLG